MAQPCFAQKFCRSSINDWKLKPRPRFCPSSPRLRAIGPPTTWGCDGDIGATHSARCEIFRMDRRTSGRRAAARQLARRPIQPAIADPHRGDHQNKENKLRKRKHRRDLRGARKPGQGRPPNRAEAHSPYLAQSSRASIQSARSAISEKGSRPRKGRRLGKGQRRRLAAIGRSLTFSP
jgi:hypothetical protein